MRSFKPACSASADPDDDDGGGARRYAACHQRRHRFGTAPSTRITIVGGLIVSQILTLYTTPVVYLYLDRLRLWWARMRAKPDAMVEPALMEGSARDIA